MARAAQRGADRGSAGQAAGGHELRHRVELLACGQVLAVEEEDLFAFRFEDFRLEGYDPHPHIKAQVSV